MRTTTKSDLIGCLEDLVPSKEETTVPNIQVSIIDGSAIVNMLRPGSAQTFLDYAQQVFLPYIVAQLHHTGRVDIVWDQHFSDNLKGETRRKRGRGVRRRVQASSTIPGNWQEFLRIYENKIELFAFLATIVTSMTSESNKEVISTYNSDVLSNHPRDLARLAPCTHEGADTRIILHLEDAVKDGNDKLSIRTVDTDVVVLAVTAAQQLDILRTVDCVRNWKALSIPGCS